MNMRKIDSAARAVRLPDTALSHLRTLTVNIVCFDQYTKRIRLSEDLAFALGLMKTAAIIPIQSKGLLMVAETLPYKDAIPVSLENNGGAKTIYNYGVVDLLIEVFGLDFTHNRNKYFKNITLKTLRGTPVALINILDEANLGY